MPTPANPATAPAQRVDVTDQLSANLDWSTLQFTEAGFGDTVITVPVAGNYYFTTVPMTLNGTYFEVEVELSFDTTTGVVTAVFQAIDPATSLPPDVLTGFLPPEDGTGIGQGHLGYTIRPKAGLPSGTELRNVAFITFDNQEIIATNQIDPQDASQGTDPAKEALNTLDTAGPTSSVAPLTAARTTTSFTIAWSGSDDAGGSGVARYDVLVSDNSGAFTPFVTGTTDTSVQFTGQFGHTYAFYSLATDNVGHVEAAPATPDAVTTLVIPLAVTAGSDQSAVEGAVVSLPGASYATSEPTDQLTMQVDWGDNTIEPGSLVPGTDGGTLANTHRYAHVGNYTVTLTLSDDAGTTVSDHLHVAVTDAPLTDTTPITTIAGTQGLATTNVLLMTFTDANPFATAGEFSVTSLNWGGTLAGTAPTVSVVKDASYSGSASGWKVVADTVTYATSGTHTVSLTVVETDNTSTSASTSKISFNIMSGGDLVDKSPVKTVSATEGKSTGNVVLATFTDAIRSASASAFAGTTVNWGGTLVGTPTVSVQLVSRSATVSTWKVVGSATYLDAGTFHVTVTVHGTHASTLVSSNTTFNVADATLTDTTPSSMNIAHRGRSTGNVVLATFTDANPYATAADFAVNVNWGGALVGTSTVSVQLVSRSKTASYWKVVGNATYANLGVYAVTVTVNDIDGSTTNNKRFGIPKTWFRVLT